MHDSINLCADNVCAVCTRLSGRQVVPVDGIVVDGASAVGESMTCDYQWHTLGERNATYDDAAARRR
jgi:hypothetical protein